MKLKALDGLIIVDLSPVWFPVLGDPQMDDVRAVWHRIAQLADLLKGQEQNGVPIVTMESKLLHLKPHHGEFYPIEPFLDQAWGICGLYGDLCVEEVYEWLRPCCEAVLLKDCIVWPPGTRRRGEWASKFWPALNAMPAG